MKKRVKNTNKLKRRRKKRKRNSNIIIGLILIIILFLGIFKFTSTINKPLKISNEEVVLVEEGDSFYSNTWRRGGCLSSVCLSEAILYARALAVQP